METPLAQTLRRLMERDRTGVRRLAERSGVPEKTLEKWLGGEVRRPRSWQDLVKVGQALNLTEAEVDELLAAAQQPALQALRNTAKQEADRALLALRSPVFPVAVTTAPFQAPWNIPFFVGRTAELAHIKTLLLNGGHAVVCGVTGMGGVGKTVLAAQLAYLLRDDFPDGVLWARVDISDTMAILSSFASAYEKDVTQHRDVASRAGAVRSLLANKRVLLVLDNVEHDQQLEWLLPPSTGRCAILITTRNHDLTKVHSQAYVALDVFAVESGEALALFGHFLDQVVVQRQRTYLLQLAALLDHLPLALAICAGQLATLLRQQKYSAEAEVGAIQSLLQQMRIEERRLSYLQRGDLNVRLSFNLSFVSLLPEQQQFFACLGIFGGADFSREAVAHLVETTVEEAQAHLILLTSRSLVQGSSAGRYRLHPLLRDYAREQMGRLFTAAQADLINERLVDFFIQAIAARTLRKLDQENVWAALRFLLQRSWQPTTADKIHTLVQFLHRNDSAEPIVPVLQNAVERAHNASDERGLARLLTLLGYNLWWLGENPAPYYQSAVELALQADASEVAANTLRLLGGFWRLRGDYSQAYACYDRALAITRKDNNRLGLLGLLNSLGTLLVRIGDLAAAEKCLQEAMSLLAPDDDGSRQVIMSQSMGNLRSMQGLHEEADQWHQTAIFWARQEERNNLLLGALGDRTEAALLAGASQLSIAETCAQESLAISQAMNFQQGVCDALERLGKCAQMRGDYDQAHQFLAKALTAATSGGLREAEASIYFTCAQLAHGQEQITTAVTSGRQSLLIYEVLNHADAAKVRRWLENCGLKH